MSDQSSQIPTRRIAPSAFKQQGHVDEIALPSAEEYADGPMPVNPNFITHADPPREASDPLPKSAPRSYTRLDGRVMQRALYFCSQHTEWGELTLHEMASISECPKGSIRHSCDYGVPVRGLQFHRVEDAA